MGSAAQSTGQLAGNRDVAGLKIKPIHFERSWPYVGAVAFVCGWLYLTGGSKFPSDPLPMLAAAGTVRGNRLRRHAVQLSARGSVGSLGVLVISFVGFFSLADGIAPKWFAILFVAFAACSILLFVRIATILSKLLKNAS